MLTVSTGPEVMWTKIKNANRMNVAVATFSHLVGRVCISEQLDFNQQFTENCFSKREESNLRSNSLCFGTNFSFILQSV